MLVFSYLFSAFANGDWVGAIQIVLFVAVATLAIRNGRFRRRTAREAIILGIAGSAVAVTLTLTHSRDAGAGVAKIWTGLMLLFAVIVIVRRVLAQPEVTLQSIYGAVSAYMIIGLMFAAFYSAMGRFNNGMFFAHGAAASTQIYQYFSFTTLTTLGYGDFTAVYSSGRAVAVLEALIGQVFLATLVARLVAGFRSARRGQPAGSAGQDQRATGRYPCGPGRHGGVRQGTDRYARWRKQAGAQSAGAESAGTRSVVRRISSRGREPPERKSRPRPER